MARPHPAALGIRVKSGWAMAVLLAGSIRAPRVVRRVRIELSDPRVPRSRQPYHAGFGLAQSSRSTIARLMRVVERCARKSVADLVHDARATGYALRGAAVVVGSVTDPVSITNPHIRAHASEGALFRRVVLAALRRRTGSVVVLERELYAMTARALRRREHTVKAKVAELGSGIAGSWRGEEKAAAAGAWLALARPPRR